MASSLKLIKQLRQETGLGLGKVRDALQETSYDYDVAKKLLKERSKEFISLDDTNEGTIAFYMHHNYQIGAMVELACSTDFNAKSEEFRNLANAIAIHIAGANPVVVCQEKLADCLIDAELDRVMFSNSGKPDHIVERIKKGAMKKFFAQHCLLNQPFVKDESKTIGEMLSEFGAKTGENIVVKRFARFTIAK